MTTLRMMMIMMVSASLAGCEPPDPSVPLPPPKIERTMLRDTTPKSLRTCAPEPNGAAVEDSVAAGAAYIDELREAGRDCRRKVKALDRLIQNEAE